MSGRAVAGILAIAAVLAAAVIARLVLGRSIDGALVVGLVALGVPWVAAVAAVALKAAVAWLPVSDCCRTGAQSASLRESRSPLPLRLFAHRTVAHYRSVLHVRIGRGGRKESRSIPGCVGVPRRWSP